MATLEEARGAKAALKTRLRGVTGVNGVGIAGSDEEGWCVRVNLIEGSEPSLELIPAQLEGVPVSTQVTGMPRAQVAMEGVPTQDD